MCDYCIETTCEHCTKYAMCLERPDGLYFCYECLGKITSSERIAYII